MLHSPAVPKGQYLYTKARRDKLILLGLRAGKTNPQIARDMGLADQTVKGYVMEIMAELGAATRTDAVMIAMSKGLIMMPTRRGM